MNARANNRITWVIFMLLAGVALASLGVFVGYCLFSSTEEGGLWGLSPPLILRQQSYMEVIRQIESGRLPIANHVVYLPTDDRSVARKVDAERRADGRLFVLFVTWRGRGADVNGYLYCSRPLRPADFCVGPGGHEQLDACGIDDLGPVHIRGLWYYVCRRLG